MVYDSRRYWIHLKVGHHICSDDHGTFFFAEGRNHFREGIRAAIYVVAVELDGKFSTMNTSHGKVPASPDLKVVPFRDNMDKCLIFSGYLPENIRGPVG